MTADATPAVRRSARSIVWTRRRRAFARNWKEYRRNREGLIGLVMLAFFAFLALAGPWLVDPETTAVITAPGRPFEPPSSQFWLGTDEFGRPILALLIEGARVSLMVGLIATVFSIVIGTVVGIMAGHFGGWTDTVLMRISDWLLVLPFLPLAIVLLVILQSSSWLQISPVTAIAIVVGITSWPATARLIRSQTLAVKSRPYLERARALGAGHWHQMSRHILPNVMPLVLANTTLTVAGAVLAETTLSFIGLGDPLRHSWGTTLDGAFGSGAISIGAWWYLIPPGVAIVLVVLAFTWVGHALETVLNPRLQGR
jgi:peptide/nickel transport system permease protein